MIAQLPSDPIVGPLPYTPEWWAARRSCIGASQAAAACGVSPYAQPLDVYLECRGEYQREETAAMRLGKALEPVVLSEYELRTAARLIRPVGLYRSRFYPFIGATPDALRESDLVPVDAKTSTHWRAGEFGDEGTDQIPADYVMQAQQQIYVCGAEFADVAVLIDGRTLRVYRVRRHDSLIARLVEMETALWERIERGTPPEPEWNHRGTLELLKRLHGCARGELVALPDEAAGYWDRYARIGRTVKRCEAVREELYARVLHAIGDTPGGILPDGREVGKTIVEESVWTEQDIEDLRVKVGTTKRRGYVTLRERKARR